MEIWLDCRACKGPLEASLPLECDRRIICSEQLVVGASDIVWEAEGGRLLDADKHVVGAAYSGEAIETQRRALAAIGSTEWVVLDATDGAVCVPAENLIAAGREAGTRVAVAAANAEQVAGLASALQLGVDALVIRASADGTGEAPQDLWESAVEAKKASRHRTCPAGDVGTALRKELPSSDSEVQAAKVVSVACVGGLGDRVCLDLIQLMKEGEGALIGSSAKALCFVHAETAQTGLVPPRPFRINAGPVHAYVAMKGGRTKYLSEIDAGDEILVVDASAALQGVPVSSRCIAVGRCKVEPRPMLCIRFVTISDDTEGHADNLASGQIFLQQAETVRVAARRAGCGKKWVPCSVTDLRAEDEILVHWTDMGTHVGRRITASVSER